MDINEKSINKRSSLWGFFCCIVGVIKSNNNVSYIDLFFLVYCVHRNLFFFMLPVALLQTLLPTQFAISDDQLKQYDEQARKAGKRLEEFLVAKDIVKEDVLYQKAAEQLGVPYISLNGKEINIGVLELIPAPLAHTHQVVAIAKTEKEIQLAMVDPLDIQTIEFIRRKTGLEPKVSITSPTEIKEALRRYHADLEQDIKFLENKKKKKIDATDIAKGAEELPVIKIMDSVLEHAIYEGASDIHIEPNEKGVVVRYRVDGVLREVMVLPKKIQDGLLARLKILSNVKIDEHMVPQDGRFKIMLDEEAFSFRVSIMPVFGGEKIVLRILREGQKPLTLDQLGFLPKARADVEEALEKPHGMILVTGPTGSGKTTTLYSMLGIVNEPGVNICTIEDPIEYHVGGINQSQVNTRVGFSFASGLRAFLRQDPDIIMVGEIRDQETAEIAIHAAMTGHQVLSTLHTNDAPTTIPRLTDMNVPAFLIAFTVNIIIAQRLVRRVCQYCKQPYTIEKQVLDDLGKFIDIKNIIPLLQNQGVALEKNEQDASTMTFYRGAGCRRCGNSGYKGRVGIYEVLPVGKEFSAAVSSGADADKLKEVAIKNGMVTMLEDGVVKAKQGVTTLEEVLRATRE